MQPSAPVTTLASILISNTVIDVPDVVSIPHNENIITDPLAKLAAPVPTKREKKRNAQKYLASQYSQKKQVVDICIAIIYTLFTARLAFYTITSITSVTDVITLITAATLGALFADFFSGVVHWACDTWGTIDTPIFGRNLIRSFREHHVDPTAITRHPFPETNGNSMIVALPAIITLNFVSATRTDLTFLFVAFVFLWLSFTNQIHKWAHTYKPPFIVSKLQQWHIILESKAHNFHHFSPYDRDYCITTGWLNPFFQNNDLWKKMKNVVTKIFGLIPREDDKAWTMQD